MKQRIFTLLIAFATAFAANAQSYNIEVCKVKVTDENKDDIAAAINAVSPGTVSGTITYDAANGKLVLNNVNINSETATHLIGINLTGSVTPKYIIELIGENTITSTDNNACGISVGVVGDSREDTEVTIEGSGSLSIDVSKGYYAIAPKYATVIINQTTVNAKGWRGIVGNNESKLVIKKANVTTTNVMTFNEIILTDCEIAEPVGAEIAKEGDSFVGIYADGVHANNVVIKPTTGTSINTIEHSQLKIDSWYSIDGKKLNGEPTKKGVYIHKGKKVVK